MKLSKMITQTNLLPQKVIQCKQEVSTYMLVKQKNLKYLNKIGMNKDEFENESANDYEEEYVDFKYYQKKEVKMNRHGELKIVLESLLANL